MSNKPKAGHPREEIAGAGLHLLLQPEWKKMQPKLRKLAGAETFFALPLDKQTKVFVRLASLALLPSEKVLEVERAKSLDKRDRTEVELVNVTRNWLLECYAQFPEVTLFALLKLRDRAREIQKPRGQNSREHRNDYWLAFAGAAPGADGVIGKLSQQTRDGRRDLRRAKEEMDVAKKRDARKIQNAHKKTP